MAIQLTLQAARMARVSGIATDSEGRPLRDGRVVVRSAGGSAMTSVMGAVAADGSFSLANVPPGEHSIEVATQPRTPDAPPETASMPVTVGNQDFTGLRIITAQAGSVSGTVQFEGDSPRTGVLGGLRITAQRADPNQSGPLLGFDERGLVRENGAFELRATGKVFFRPINLGPWMLKSVRMNGDDITDAPYDLTGAGNLDGLRIVLTDRVTSVAGGVIDDRKQPLKEFVVVVQPVDEVAANVLQRFLRTARPDQDGKFGLQGIPLADYIATAVEALEQGGEWDPEYRSRLRDAGRRFSVKEGQSIQLDLELASGL